MGRPRGGLAVAQIICIGFQRFQTKSNWLSWFSQVGKPMNNGFGLFPHGKTFGPRKTIMNDASGIALWGSAGVGVGRGGGKESERARVSEGVSA